MIPVIGFLGLIWGAVSAEPLPDLTALDDRPQPDWVSQVYPDLNARHVTVLHNSIQGEQDGVGSGVLIGDGLVVTCFHKVGTRRKIVVVTESGHKFEPTKIVTWDANADLAILKLPVPDQERLAPMKLVEKDSEVGTPIAVMGNPGGDHSSLFSAVIASESIAIGGQLVTPLGVLIEKGNSEGSVVNQRGELIGVVSMKDLRHRSLGCAVPSLAIRKLLQSKAETVSYQKWLNRSSVNQSYWTADEAANWFQERWGFKVEHDPDDLTGERMGEDPRRLFEDREGGVVSMQALVLDLVRRHGLPHAGSIGKHGFIVCDKRVKPEKSHYIHSCNGEDFSAREMILQGCGSNPNQLQLLNDKQFLLHPLKPGRTDAPE